MLADRARILLTAAADGGATQDMARRAAQDFIDASRRADASEVRTALEILGRAYSLPNTEHLPLALTSAGALVERGADPTPLVAPVVEFLERVTPLAANFQDACIAQIPADANDEDDEDDEDAAFQQVAVRLKPEMPEAAAAWGALEALYAPLIAVLAASPTARAQSRSIAAQMNKLRRYNDGATWLAPMLMVLDREPILAIEPDTGLGFVGRMSGISSNFQLHVLLMDVFPQSGAQGGRRISQKTADIVRGRIGDQEDNAPLVGRWNMHAWTALREAVALPGDHDEASINHWIWNEGTPRDIPLFDGYRVVALGPASYARSFFAQREFLGLRADIEVERLLSADEVNAWVKRFSSTA